MSVAQSIAVSVPWVVSDEVTITNDPPAGGTHPPLILGSWEPPTFAQRLDYLPDNPDVSGKFLRSQALDQGTLPLVIDVYGTDMADLQTNRRAVEAMFSQFTYTVTLTFDGVSEVYDAFPTWPQWSLDLPNRIATATLSVPVNPMGA
jgi:hypothetical protein